MYIRENENAEEVEAQWAKQAKEAYEKFLTDGHRAGFTSDQLSFLWNNCSNLQMTDYFGERRQQ